MSAVPHLADPLRAFLSGKRRTPRLEMQLAVRVVAPGFEVAGAIVDISEGGALLGIDSADLAAQGLAGSIAMLSLHERLGSGFRIHFTELDLEREALPVRIATRMGDEDRTYVGCRFTSPLTVPEQRRVGLLDQHRALLTPEWTEPVLFEALPLLVRKGVAIEVLAFGGARVLGPQFVGRLVGVGGTALAAASYIARDRGVFETVGDQPLTVQLRRGTQDLWTTTARPAAVRPGVNAGEPVQIGLVAEQTPPLALRELLVQRA